MATVKVQFLPYFASLLGQDMEKLTILRETKEGLTIRELLEELSAEYESSFNEVIYNPVLHELNEMTMVLVNGLIMHALNGLETVVREGDVIVLSPLITGG